MPSITFDLETVTPLFLGGADQTTAELRPPAFRGALRYWFRTMVCSITDFAKASAWENKVFGNTSGASPVVIRIQNMEFTSQKRLTKDDDFSGLNYLLFSTYESRQKSARGCFPEEYKFKLILQTRLNTTESLQYLKLAVASLWMLVNFGGIGSRSNRGAGSLKVNNIKFQNFTWNSPTFQIISDKLEGVKSELETGLGQIRQIFEEIIGTDIENSSFPSLTSSDIMHSQTSDIYLWEPSNFEDNEYWDYILDSFGLEYQNFRKRYKKATSDDYPQVKDWITKRKPVITVKRAAFGLPIQFYFTSLPKPNNKASLEARLGSNKINRSTSPFRIKVLPIGGNRLAIILIYFHTQLLPAGAQLVLKNQGQTINCHVPDQSIIKEFLGTLSNLVKVQIP